MIRRSTPRALPIATLLPLAACPCARHADPESLPQPVAPAATVDRSTPTAVVQAVFDAARTGDTSRLATLCDPQGENDADTRQICGTTVGTAAWGRFALYFGEATFAGEPVVDGDTAKVPFRYGPGSTVEPSGPGIAEMGLVRRDGAWYLWTL